MRIIERIITIIILAVVLICGVYYDLLPLLGIGFSF
jgi:hypothetical protein